jgi:DNA-directed RNA polymerase I, II, and III subunit RPABC1
LQKDINENNIKNIKLSFSKTEIFLENDLIGNILDSEFVSPYEIIAKESEMYKGFMEDYISRKGNVPKLYSTEPMALYYNLKKGDLVRVLRPSESTGQSAFYRLVV